MKPYYEIVDMPYRSLHAWAFTVSSFDGSINVHPHWHNEIEILYVAKGSALQQINDRVFNIQKGDLVIIGNSAIHSTYTQGSEETEILVLMAGADLFEQGSSSGLAEHFNLFEANMEYPSPVRSDEGVGMDLVNCMYDIKQECDEKEPFFEIIIKSHIYRLIGTILRAFSKEGKKAEDTYFLLRAKEMLTNTFALIEERYHGELSLQDAAKASNLSMSHFCRLFKKATGMTFSDYLSYYRINQAEQLLRTEKTITEIAYLCGFKSAITFIRAFKKYKNCTPSSYRKSL